MDQLTGRLRDLPAGNAAWPARAPGQGPGQHRGLVLSAGPRPGGDDQRKGPPAAGWPFGRIRSRRAPWHDVLALDDRLETEIEPAFAEDLGYLTASPADVGTGLHVSALLHLPGLVLAGEIDKVLNALRQLQFSVRGLFGRAARCAAPCSGSPT